MSDFLSGFLSHIGNFFNFLTKIPSFLGGIVNMFGSLFYMIDPEIGSLMIILIYGLLSFVFIYSIVKLVLSLL